MSDPLNPTNSPGDEIDAQLRRLVADASADAPPAPDSSAFIGVPAAPVHSLDARRQVRRRWLAGGAVGLTAAAAAVTFVVIGNEPTDTMVPATAPVTEPTPSTIVSEVPDNQEPAPQTTVATPATSNVTEQPVQPSTTAEVVVSTAEPVESDPLASTYVALGDPFTDLETYEFDFAVAPLNREDSADPTRAVRYRTDDGGHAIVIRSGPRRYTADGAPIGTAGGRDVYDSDAFDRDIVGTCTSVSCAVWIPWDDTTDVSIQWVAPPDTTAVGTDPEPVLERLLQVARQLTDVAGSAPFARPTIVESGPTITNDGIIIADQNGVTVRDGWERAPLQLTTTPAFSAVGLPDGRVLISTGSGRGLPGELFTVAPFENSDLIPFWVDGVPEDGTVRIDVKDAATVDGTSTILYQATTGSCSGGQDGTFECDGTLDVAAIPVFDGQPLDRATDPSTVRDLGSVWEAGISVDLTDGGSLPDISGVHYQLVTSMPYFDSIGDDEWIDLSPNYEATYSEATVHIRLDDGYVVDYIDEPNYADPGAVAPPMVRVSDRVGDAETSFSLDGVLPIAGLNQQQAPVIDITPNIRRGTTFGAQGTVWITTYEDAAADADPGVLVTTLFIEVDLAGSEVSRVSTGQTADINASLTTNNR